MNEENRTINKEISFISFNFHFLNNFPGTLIAITQLQNCQNITFLDRFLCYRLKKIIYEKIKINSSEEERINIDKIIYLDEIYEKIQRKSIVFIKIYNSYLNILLNDSPSNYEYEQLIKKLLEIKKIIKNFHSKCKENPKCNFFFILDIILFIYKFFFSINFIIK